MFEKDLEKVRLNEQAGEIRQNSRQQVEHAKLYSDPLQA